VKQENKSFFGNKTVRGAQVYFIVGCVAGAEVQRNRVCAAI